MQNLDREQKRQLEYQLKTARKACERNRLCVILGYDDGLSIEELTLALRISSATAYNYLNDFWKKQKTTNAPKSGRPRKLNSEQSEELRKHLTETTYLKVIDICAYTMSTFNVSLSRSCMTDWLHENSFVFKCPLKVPGKLKPDLQKAHIKMYEQLKLTLQPNEEIYFVDAVHPEHQTQATRGWMPKGSKKTLQTTGKQLRLHFSGALNIKDMKVFTREYESINADAMCDFFQGLENSTKASKIYVILDNARANKNKKINEFLKTSRIKPIYLVRAHTVSRTHPST